MAANERQQVKTYPGGLATDVLFWESRSGTLPKNKQPQYGDPHPNVDLWPHHKLCFIEPSPTQDNPLQQNWYYAADRENQDLYNYVMDGDNLIRTYIIPRDQYLARPAVLTYATGSVEFTTDITTFLISVGGEAGFLPSFPGSLTPEEAATWLAGNWNPDYKTTAVAVGSSVVFTSKIGGPVGNSYAINVVVGTGVTKSGDALNGGGYGSPGSPFIAGEFLFPPAGEESPDPVFSRYAFIDDTLVKSEKEIDSIFVTIRRRFVKPFTLDIVWDDDLERYVRITKTVVPYTYEEVPTASPGTRYELRDGNYFHNILIKQELMLSGEETYPIQLASVPDTYPGRQFPPRLDSVDLVYMWARAESETAAPSYSEDFYFKFKITEPRPGPFSATMLRFITDDPEALKATYPITPVPSPVRESLAIAAAWFYASPEVNRTMAVAKEYPLPATIHGPLTVSIGGVADPPSQNKAFDPEIAATPGYTEFTGVTEFIADYQVSRSKFGLFDVRVLIVDLTGLYPSGSGGGPVSGPSLLTATAGPGNGEVTLEWALDLDAFSYSVHRSTDGVNYSHVAYVGVPEYTDTGLTADTTYFYKVRSFNSDNFSFSSYSDPVEVTTLP